MENPEEVLQSLDEFAKLKPKDIPKELEEYLSYVAKTGDPVYQWSLVKYLFREKLLNVIAEFYEGCPTIEVPPCPNVDTFNYEIMKNSLLERLETFVSAPFTVQRLCELLTSPKKQYSRADKFMRAIEKNILVVSTREPGNVRRTDPSQTELVNGVSEGPMVELGEAVETVTADGINLMHVDSGAARLGLGDHPIASTTRLDNVDPKCSHTADVAEGLPPVVEPPQKGMSWMNDPSLTDPNRPSVSERIALIEKVGLDGSRANLDVGTDQHNEFHPGYSQPISEPNILEEEDDEDYIPSSQDDTSNQYFSPQKQKTPATDDFCNPPSSEEETSETSAAVSAISEETSNPISETSTLEEIDVPQEMSSLSSENSQDVLSSTAVLETATDIDAAILDSSPAIVANLEIAQLVPETTKLETVPTENLELASSEAVNLDTINVATPSPDVVDLPSQNLDISSLDAAIPETFDALSDKVEPPVPESTESRVEIPEVLEPDDQKEPSTGEMTAAVAPAIIVEEPDSSNIPEESIPEPQPVVEEAASPPVPETIAPITAAEPAVDKEVDVGLEAAESVDVPVLADIEPAESSVENSDKLPAERDREMLVQSERIESVIQENFEQAPVVLDPIVGQEVSEELPPVAAATPMEDKPIDVEPEAMEVDETSQTADEPMEQEDLSPTDS